GPIFPRSHLRSVEWWVSWSNRGMRMTFLIYRTSEGAVSKAAPCKGAVRGPESPAWPGEHEWYVELNSLEELMALLSATGGGLGLFPPEGGEEHPVLEIFDDDEDDEGTTNAARKSRAPGAINGSPRAALPSGGALPLPVRGCVPVLPCSVRSIPALVPRR